MVLAVSLAKCPQFGLASRFRRLPTAALRESLARYLEVWAERRQENLRGTDRRDRDHGFGVVGAGLRVLAVQLGVGGRPRRYRHRLPVCWPADRGDLGHRRWSAPRRSERPGRGLSRHEGARDHSGRGPVGWLRPPPTPPRRLPRSTWRGISEPGCVYFYHIRKVPPAHKNHTGTDCGWASRRTVVNQTISSSRSRLSARAPDSVVVSSTAPPFSVLPFVP